VHTVAEEESHGVAKVEDVVTDGGLKGVLAMQIEARI